jgi:hypothetical protein
MTIPNLHPTCLTGQAAQNGHPARPQAMPTLEVYPLGYIEDVGKLRTKLGTIFSNLSYHRRAGWTGYPAFIQAFMLPLTL